VLSTPGAARDAIFSLERGVCQLCGLDTHALLHALLAEPSLPERMKMLEAGTGRIPIRPYVPSSES
jgi:hypothetical protein